MRHERLGITFLLGLLLLLSSILGALHASEKPKDGLATRSNQEILKTLEPLVRSESIEQIVEHLNPIKSVDKARGILELIVKQNVLRDDDIVLLIGGVALNYANNQQDQQKLFSLILEYPELRKKEVMPFYIFASSVYDAVIPAFLRWLKSDIKAKKIVKSDAMIVAALNEAVKKSNLRALEKMQIHGLITPQKASQLLWLAVSNERNKDIVELLIRAQADVNYDVKGITVLMQAARKYQYPMVQLLVNKGADVNKIVSDEVGTVLQMVVDIERNLLESKKSKANAKKFDIIHSIEHFLRLRGAQEVVKPLVYNTTA